MKHDRNDEEVDRNISRVGFIKDEVDKEILSH